MSERGEQGLLASELTNGVTSRYGYARKRRHTHTHICEGGGEVQNKREAGRNGEKEKNRENDAERDGKRRQDRRAHTYT